MWEIDERNRQDRIAAEIAGEERYRGAVYDMANFLLDLRFLRLMRHDAANCSAMLLYFQYLDLEVPAGRNHKRVLKEIQKDLEKLVKDLQSATQRTVAISSSLGGAYDQTCRRLEGILAIKDMLCAVHNENTKITALSVPTLCRISLIFSRMWYALPNTNT